MRTHKQMTMGLIGHGRRRTEVARHKAPSVWVVTDVTGKGYRHDGKMGCCWPP